LGEYIFLYLEEIFLRRKFFWENIFFGPKKSLLRKKIFVCPKKMFGKKKFWSILELLNFDLFYMWMFKNAVLADLMLIFCKII